MDVSTGTPVSFVDLTAPLVQGRTRRATTAAQAGVITGGATTTAQAGLITGQPVRHAVPPAQDPPPLEGIHSAQQEALSTILERQETLRIILERQKLQEEEIRRLRQTLHEERLAAADAGAAAARAAVAAGTAALPTACAGQPTPVNDDPPPQDLSLTQVAPHNLTPQDQPPQDPSPQDPSPNWRQTRPAAAVPQPPLPQPQPPQQPQQWQLPQQAQRPPPQAQHVQPPADEALSQFLELPPQATQQPMHSMRSMHSLHQVASPLRGCLVAAAPRQPVMYAPPYHPAMQQQPPANAQLAALQFAQRLHSDAQRSREMMEFAREERETRERFAREERLSRERVMEHAREERESRERERLLHHFSAHYQQDQAPFMQMVPTQAYDMQTMQQFAASAASSYFSGNSQQQPPQQQPPRQQPPQHQPNYYQQ